MMMRQGNCWFMKGPREAEGPQLPDSKWLCCQRAWFNISPPFISVLFEREHWPSSLALIAMCSPGGETGRKEEREEEAMKRSRLTRETAQIVSMTSFIHVQEIKRSNNKRFIMPEKQYQLQTSSGIIYSSTKNHPVESSVQSPRGSACLEY